MCLVMSGLHDTKLPESSSSSLDSLCSTSFRGLNSRECLLKQPEFVVWKRVCGLHYLEGAFPGCRLEVRCSSHNASAPWLICFMCSLHGESFTALIVSMIVSMKKG